MASNVRWPEQPPPEHGAEESTEHSRVLAIRGATTIERDEADQVRSGQIRNDGTISRDG